MAECRTVWHQFSQVPEKTKILMPEAVWYRHKGTHSRTGMLRYQTEIPDAGMRMKTASTLMSMPSYG
jgi:hypothetical protein